MTSSPPSKESVESEIGRDLDWDRIEGKQACRISSYYPDSPIEVTADEETLTALKEWAIEEMMKFRHGLKPLVQGLTADAAVNQGA